MGSKGKRILGLVLALLSGMEGGFAHADLQRFMEVAPGVFRGDQPDRLSDYETLKQKGVRTLLNLRDDSTVDIERKIAAQLSFNFESIPLSAMKYPEDEKIDRAMEVITDPSLQPVYIHCQFGKDRTGLLVALYRVWVEGVSRSAAYREWRAMGFNPLLVPLSSYFLFRTSGLN